MSEADDYSRHEVMHAAFLLSDLFDRHIVDHAFVATNADIRKRAEAISGLLGELYQVVAGQYDASVRDRRPAWHKEVAERATVSGRILHVIRKRLGLTELQIAQELFGPEAIQQHVNADCRLLLGQGLVVRRGAGGPSDPFTYHLP